MSQQQAKKLPANADMQQEAGTGVERKASAHEIHLLADFLEQGEAAAELKVCRRTLDRWRRLGEGPPITKLGRRNLYSRSSLFAWLRAREHQRSAP
jgi:hypothetical protein